MLNQTALTPTDARPENWQPTIVAVVCNWCTYAGADRADNFAQFVEE